MTALHYAALYGKKYAVAKLLQCGPKELVNKVTNGFTPFMRAVAKGFDEIVEYLMNLGDIDPCVKLGDGRNVLHIGAKRNRLKVLQTLLDKTSKDTAKKRTGQMSNDTLPMERTDQMSSETLPRERTGQMSNDSLPREKSGQMSSINKIQKLINAPDNEKNRTTPLHTASRFGHVNVFEILLKYGANPFLLDSEMKTPLHIAKKMALQNGEFLHKKDGNGDTVFHLMAKDGHDRPLDVQLREDKENIVNCKNNDGCTPLWLAAASGHLKCVEHMLSRDASIEMTNKSKLTPLMVASQNGHADVVEYMINKNANVSALDEKKRNCLEIAILERHT
ncbi:ANK2-like protein [Mya arenaria]|uniref:ANK2-like protein n=1 Tax=Mya arenaria TaxID=6604 RepID=A0ABY7EJE1_MYAAR|nr:ANK2-like protein [Mya arenaria]